LICSSGKQKGKTSYRGQVGAEPMESIGGHQPQESAALWLASTWWWTSASFACVLVVRQLRLYGTTRGVKSIFSRMKVLQWKSYCTTKRRAKILRSQDLPNFEAIGQKIGTSKKLQVW